jgi:hypothetical protein
VLRLIMQGIQDEQSLGVAQCLADIAVQQAEFVEGRFVYHRAMYSFIRIHMQYSRITKELLVTFVTWKP